VQKGNGFNWWYLYSFRTTDGHNAQGKIVLSERTRFDVGAKVPVVYVQSDPADNRYANDPMPRSVRDWFFIGLGLFMVGVIVLRLRADLAGYRHLRRLARFGLPLPGNIVKAHLAGAGMNPDLPVEIEYRFKTCAGETFDAKAQIKFVHLACRAI